MPRPTVKRIWLRGLAKLGGLLAVAALLGIAVGQLWIVLTLTLAGYLGWHLANLYRLHCWLHRKRRIRPSQGSGLWADILWRLREREQESSQRKKRLSAVVREFRQATAALPDATVVMDKDMRIVWCNAGAKQLLGLHQSKDVGRPLADLVRDPALSGWLSNVAGSPEGLVLNSPADDERKLSLRLFDYADGQHLLIGRDITRIEQAEQMRKDFVANVSHELRTPLTVVSGYIETMADEVDAEWVPVVDRVEEQTARMRAIVEDLLTLSRLDSAESLEAEEQVAADELAREALEAAEVISENQHEISARIQPGLHLLGSQQDLSSCFTNLVSNALRYTPVGGRIEVRWELIDDHAVFAVKDNGPGIAAHHLPRLTERFYRVSTDRSRTSGGTGLGLAIVKHILALHQAHLDIRSKLGAGSEFRCTFPPERVIHSSDARRQSASP